MSRRLHALALAVPLTAASLSVIADEASDAAKLEAKRAEMAPIVKPLIVDGPDLQIRLPYKLLVQAIDGLNALPPASRTVTLRSFRAPLAHIWEDGSTWCNSYAEIQGNNDLNADALLSKFAATPNPDGSIRLGAHADVSAKAQVHWHFMGRRVSVFGLGNACPPGGGFGGSIGASGTTGADLGLAMKLAQSTKTGVIDYDVSLVQPGSVNITLQLGFQHIGNLGVPISLAVPQGSIAKGSLAFAFEKEGSVELPGGGAKTYDIALAPTALVSDADGIRASWKAKISFK